MGITQSKFEALTEIANQLTSLTKEFRRHAQELRMLADDLKDWRPPILSDIQQTEDDATSLESSTVIVDHPHVAIVPLQTKVSTDQPHVDSTQKAIDSTQLEVVPFPKTVQCVGGLFHHSTSPSHFMIVSYGIGQSSSLVFPSSSGIVVPTNSFNGCPSLGSSSPLFAHQLILRLPLLAAPFALLLVGPFDRGKCWLSDHEVLKLEDKLDVQEGSNDMIRKIKSIRNQEID